MSAPVAELEPSRTIELDPPLMLKQAEYTRLELREPTAGEVLKASKATGIDFIVLLVQQVSGLPLAAIYLLPYRTLMEAFDYLNAFMDPGQRTGEIS